VGDIGDGVRRVAGCGLRVAGCGLRVACCVLSVVVSKIGINFFH